MNIPRERRPLVGPLLMAVGVTHVALTPVLFPESVKSIVAAGVVNSVEADAEQAELRGIGFWYATSGIGLIFTGWTVGALERRADPTPAALPLFLMGLGTWGVALMPKSPFWVFGALAGVAEARRKNWFSRQG